MVATDRVTARSMSDSARLFFIQLQVDDPLPQTYSLCAKAPFEFTIVSVHHSTASGDLDATFEISGATVDFATGNTNGSITADAGALDTFTPLSSLPANYTVSANQSLTVTLEGETDASGYLACMWCRRTAAE